MTQHLYEYCIDVGDLGISVVGYVRIKIYLIKKEYCYVVVLSYTFNVFGKKH